MNVGILTSGGDCPGLNAVIRAAVRKALRIDFKAYGIYGGFKGIIDGKYKELTLNDVSGIINRGGTIIGSSRYSPFEEEGGKELLIKKMEESPLDAIICVGGEGSMHVAQFAHEAGIKIVGVPKTIDNDIYGTDYSFGFDTAVNIATEAVDRLHTTAESHHRIMVLEVMGRHAGWIALYSGIAGGADAIVIPEKKITIDSIVNVIKSRADRGKLFSIIVIAEGAEFIMDELKDQYDTHDKFDDFGRKRLGGVGNYLAEELEKRCGFETRATILGYVQRGGMPTAFDRMLGTRFGVYAMRMVQEEKFGHMAALKGSVIDDIPIKEAISQLKTVVLNIYKTAEVFFK